jgi:hypothetical protein
MAGFSDYLELKILNWLRGTAFGTAPSAVYIGLFNGDPTDTGASGTEVTATIRVAGRVAATFAAPSGNSIASNAVVDFGNAAAGATVTHFAIFDAASSGNMLAAAALTGGSQSITTGTAVSFASGALTVSVD